jgi:hypothetical protein
VGEGSGTETASRSSPTRPVPHSVPTRRSRPGRVALSTGASIAAASPSESITPRATSAVHSGSGSRSADWAIAARSGRVPTGPAEPFSDSELLSLLRPRTGSGARYPRSVLDGYLGVV